MKHDLMHQAESYTRAEKQKRLWRKVVTCLACVVVFCTTYALILPAITMEKPRCGLTEHTHTVDCYTQVTAAARKEPVCSSESLGLHSHTAACYDEAGSLICGRADYVIHTHDASCYGEDGRLWCPLPEIAAHTHGEGCFTVPQAPEVHTHTDECYTTERGALICALEESEGHAHGETCYDGEGNLVCTLEEAEGHRHGDACYEQNKVLVCQLEETAEEPAQPAEPELTCSLPEIMVHTHTPDCYTDGVLTCGRLETMAHQHTDACFKTVEEAVDTEKLTCGLTEGEGAHTHDDSCYDESGELVCQLEENTGHQHGPLCYGTWELTCGLEEHTHTEACKPAGLTEEEQAQVDEVIALIDALPTQEEIEETLAAFEDAGDEDGYDAYLAGAVTQAKAAYGAYTALTEAQQAKVTNAAKLMALEPLWSVQTLPEFTPLTDDSARVTGITVTGIADGTAPWDNDDNAGNDSGADNRIVRTFDTVTYNFEVTMESYNNTSYSEARVKLEFVLPLTAEQATFDQGAMAWMDRADGYAPVLTTETRNGVTCQVLTCYKHLLPSTDHPSVVPGSFGENVTVNVKSMKNGETFAPTFSAAMEHGTWSDESCPKDGHGVEKQTIVAAPITVTAAPKYNIQIGGVANQKTTFDFSTGNATAQAYGDAYFTENSQVVGRVTKIGVAVELYNDNASKGFKGIELPDGSPITFDLTVSARYQINQPAPGTSYTQGQTLLVTDEYCPLLWSCDINWPTGFGYTNSDGRELPDSQGFADGIVPYGKNWREGSTANCYQSGKWTATQDGATIHVTVSGYAIDVNKMPITKLDGYQTYYGEDLGIGVFSAGEIWVVQPFNKIGETGDNPGPAYDIVSQYGQGAFTTGIVANSMKATTVSGQTFADSPGTSDAQTRTDDDRLYPGLELTMPGGIQNRVNYTKDMNNSVGVGVSNTRDGADFAATGTEFSIRGGFSYNARYEEGNALYYATTLVKFYGSAIEVLRSEGKTQSGNYIWQYREYFKTYYAVKPNGTDWTSDYELQHTYEDGLVFYENLSDIPNGYLCVGVLYCFSDPDNVMVVDGYYNGFVRAKVREDMSLTGNAYMMVSTTRGWTKDMFEQSGYGTMPALTGTRATDSTNLAAWVATNTPDWTQPASSRGMLPSGNYNSANVDGSTWYTKTVYAADGSGILTPHNSDWAHWGDTLLVIGYKAGITKALCQMSEPDTAKNSYNLDAEQRVVDFKLEPRTYYDQGGANHALTTTVTIVDTLPKYLTYLPGSSYFGGTYTQTSANGGTQGEITGGTLREPDSVVRNADGTQTLTWIIPDVTVGEEMPVIYYSADIGDRNNKDNDVPTGTTNLTNTVRISATHDIRQPSKDNRNYAEAGMAVTRGAASSYGKYSTQKVVESDGQIDYVIYYDNNAVADAAKPVLVDAMPVNGVLESNFSGSYYISSFKVILNGTETTLADLQAHLYYTNDTQYAGKDLAYLQAHQTNPSQDWTEVLISDDGTAPGMTGQTPVMWVLDCIRLPGNSELRVEYSIKLTPAAGSSMEGSIKYVNAFSTANNTTTTDTFAVNRTLEGLTWLDDNADGIQNEAADRRISGVKVTLLKLKEGAVIKTDGNVDAILEFKQEMYQGLTAEDIAQIRVVASSPTGGQTGMQLFYTAGAVTSANEQNSIKLPIQEGTSEYVFDLTGKWSGEIHELRLDPFQKAYASGVLESITLVLTDGSMRRFDFTAAGNAGKYLTPYNCGFDGQYSPDRGKEADYYPYAPSIETGKRISVRATGADAATAYETGRYKFTGLPAGTFAVRFEDGSGETKISSLIASLPDQGDDTKDSDGFPTYSSDHSSLKQTAILGIPMPKAEDMSVALYESKYHDSGFYQRGYELPSTGGMGATIFYAAGPVLMMGAALPLAFKKRTKKKRS